MIYTQPIPDPTLAQLQRTMLTAALLGQRLPGSKQPLLCPGVSQLLKQQTIYIAEENLSSDFSTENLPRPAQIVNRDELVSMARAGSGPVHYLQFDPVEYEHRVIRITMESTSAVVNSPLRLTSLGGVQGTFQETDEGWRAVREPIIYAP